MTEQTAPKLTRPQRAIIESAVRDQERRNAFVADLWSSGRVRRDVLQRLVDAGYVNGIGARELTRAGYAAVNRSDLFALPEVKVGELLAYATHPGCVVRVVEIADNSRAFYAEYVSVCGVCQNNDGRGDKNERTEPQPRHLPRGTVAGDRHATTEHAWLTPAYLLTKLPETERAAIAAEVERTARVFAATMNAFKRGTDGVVRPTPVLPGAIRPAYLRVCGWCNIDFGVALAGQARDAAHKAHHDAAEQRAAGLPPAAPESFNTPNGVLDGPAAVAMRDRLLLADVPVDDLAPCTLAAGHTGQHDDPTGRIATVDGPAMAAELREYGMAADECGQPVESASAPRGAVPAPAATPRFPAGTAEYESYAAELQAELRKWAQQRPPYGDGEPETAYARLSEEYGQNENDHDRNPSHAGFDGWLAEQVEQLRVEVAMRDAGRRANLGVAELVRAYGAQFAAGDASGAAAALNAVQDHVAGLLAALALAGAQRVEQVAAERDTAGRSADERVRQAFDECAGMLRAAGLDVPVADAPEVDHVPPFAVGDRVTWGSTDRPDGLRVWHVTRVWRDDNRGWSVAAKLAGDRGETRTAAPAGQFHRLPAMPTGHRVFTFGTAHSHPDLPTGTFDSTGLENLGKHFVRVPGDTEMARARMLALFGKGWAFDYAPERFEPQVERYGLIEVALPSQAYGLQGSRQLEPDSLDWVIETLGREQLDELAADLRYGR